MNYYNKIIKLGFKELPSPILNVKTHYYKDEVEVTYYADEIQILEYKQRPNGLFSDRLLSGYKQALKHTKSFIFKMDEDRVIYFSLHKQCVLSGWIVVPNTEKKYTRYTFDANKYIVMTLFNNKTIDDSFVDTLLNQLENIDKSFKRHFLLNSMGI